MKNSSYELTVPDIRHFC